MDRVRNVVLFALVGAGFAGAGLWISGGAAPLTWVLFAVVVVAMAGSGYTTYFRVQLTLLIVAGLGVVAMPYATAGMFGARQAPAFLVTGLAVVVLWALVFRRALRRQWSERWIDAPVEYEIARVLDATDDRTETLARLGFTPSRAYRLAADEDPLTVVYVHEADRIYAEVTFPRRDDLNVGWSFTSLAGPVSLSTQQTRLIASEPGELVQAVLDASLEVGYRHHLDAVRRLEQRGLTFDPVRWAAYRTHIRTEVSRYRVAFRDRPYRHAAMVDKVRKHARGHAIGPLFEQPDAEAQVAAALGIAGGSGLSPRP